MPKFIVKDPLNHDQKNYAVGKTVELTEEQADALLSIGVVEAPTAKQAKEAAV